MNTPQLPVGMDNSHISITHLTTTSSSMPVSDMMPPRHPHPLKEVTEVWHMAHFWVSNGRCTMHGSPMGRSEGSSRRWTG